ncbi:MAG: protein kinase [Candidatus Sulfotelmatobacter sp.]
MQEKGQVIGHYRVIEKIGSGGMGDVFRARDERLGRDVALKLIRPTSNDNPDHRRRFELEARAAASLNHPNICTIHEIGQQDGQYFIVMELLEGQTLRKRLSEGALPVRLAVDYSSQIVQGLIAAHDGHITHRDLKPENLFLTNEGRIKILDFGVAKLHADSERSVEELTTITRNGSVVGTVAYMSPEQLRAKTVDPRSDIFSMGAILYEMLAGHRAFQGETEVDTMTAVLLEEPPEIGLEQADIPASFQQIVRHCLEKDPQNRFQSTRDLAFALDTLSDASGVRPKRLRVRGWQVTILVKILPWVVAGGLLVGTLLLLARPSQPSPTYHRVTFEQGSIYSARFAPDFRSIVYGAAWNGKRLQLYSTVGNSLLAQPLTLSDADLLAISRDGELAVQLHGAYRTHFETEKGTLAQTPLAGGSPREVLDSVFSADWDANGKLAVVHHDQGYDRIEYPIGHVLYQSNGWISHLRFSPQSDKIAFMDHPTRWDDRGSVCVVDLGGHLTVISPEWTSEEGLAWSSDGKEVWFTASRKGIDRGLLGVTLAGRVRTILELPAAMTLQDVAPDGRTLMSLDNERMAMATTGRDGKSMDISWHDWNIAKDISRDGQSVLFEDSSEAAGSQYAVAIRKIDGTPPVRLGEGSAGQLSPDGKWAVSILPGNKGEVKLLPIGPGQPRQVSTPGLDIKNGSSRFLADGKRITLDAIEPGHGVRTYLANLEGGKPVPITPDGIAGGLISPEGEYFLRADDAGVLTAYPTVGGGAPRPIPNLMPGLIPIQWSEDNASFFAYLPDQIPTKVFRVDPVSGKATPLQELQPEMTAGVVDIAPVVAARDGSRFAYSYYQVFSVLYLISGLR